MLTILLQLCHLRFDCSGIVGCVECNGCSILLDVHYSSSEKETFHLATSDRNTSLQHMCENIMARVVSVHTAVGEQSDDNVDADGVQAPSAGVTVMTLCWLGSCAMLVAATIGVMN